MRLFFVGTVLALPFVAFAILVLVRRARYRAMAASLRGRHVSTGFGSIGAIVGEDYRIEVVKFGKQYSTQLQVRADDTIDDCVLGIEFFRNAPNWEFASVAAQRTERVFLWQVALPGRARPSDELQSRLLRRLPRSREFDELYPALKSAGIREIVVADGRVSTSLGGIVTDIARVRCALDALRRVLPSRVSNRGSASYAA